MRACAEQSLINGLDSAIRFLLCVMMFWLPYSKAMIEVCVILGIVLWLVKRFVSLRLLRRSPASKSLLSDVIRSFSVKPSALNPAIAVFVFFCFAALFASPLPGQSLKGLITKTLEWFAIYFLVIEVFVTKKQIMVVIGVLLFTAFSTGMDAIVQYFWTKTDIFNQRELVDGYRATAGFNHSNLLGSYLATVIPVALGLLLCHFRNFLRTGVLFVGLAILVLALGLTFSRGAQMGALLGILFLIGNVFLQQRGPWRRKVFLVIAVFALAFAGRFAFETRKHVNLIGDDAQTISWRIDLWKRTLGFIVERPLLGHGLNTYMPLMKDHLQATQSPPDFELSPSYAHNCYLQIAAEVGVLGLCAFLWIQGVLFFQVLRTDLQAQWEREGRLLQLGILAGLFGFLAHSFVDISFYSLQLPALFWFLAGILISLDHLLRKRGECVIR